MHLNSILIKIQLDATVYRYLFTAKSLYMFRVSQHPSSGVLKTVTAASGTGHNTGTAIGHTLLSRNLTNQEAKQGIGILSSWFRVSKFIFNKNPTRCNSTQSDLFYCKITLHVSDVTASIIRSTKNCNRNLRYTYLPPTWPDRATLEVSSCTSVMTCTGGRGYSF